jgi:hypothetical protein
MKTLIVTIAVSCVLVLAGSAQEASPSPSPSASPGPVAQSWTDQDSANLAGCYQTELWIFGALIVFPIVLLVKP